MKYIFQWDENKARVNLAKHKVSFEEGKTIFYDPFILTFRDEFHSENEDRLISIGMSINERHLLVVHLESEVTSAGAFIRIISCRKATAPERKRYEEDE